MDSPTTADTGLSPAPEDRHQPLRMNAPLDSSRAPHCLPALVALLAPHRLAVHGGSHTWQNSTGNVLCCAWRGPDTMKNELDNNNGADAKLIDFTSRRATCQSTPRPRAGGCQPFPSQKRGRGGPGRRGQRRGGKGRRGQGKRREGKRGQRRAREGKGRFRRRRRGREGEMHDDHIDLQ